MKRNDLYRAKVDQSDEQIGNGIKNALSLTQVFHQNQLEEESKE
jgi:hypothetical protein